MIGDPYATVGELTARLGSEHHTFPALVDAASRAVESFTRRQFNKETPASPTQRRFRPIDPYRLPVDDFYTTTGLEVEVNGTVWVATAYDPQPWNGIKDGVAGWPYYNLFAVNRTWPLDGIILVTAEWGWNAVPSAVKQATLDVAATIYNGGSAESPVRSEAIDGYSVSYVVNGTTPPELSSVVKYQRRRFGVA